MSTIDWSSLSVCVPDKVGNYTPEIQQSVFDYLKSLESDPKEKTAYLIAKNHLGTSFDILRSIGYTDWIKNGS